MTAFDIAINAAFSDPHISSAATYDPVVGAAYSVRAIKRSANQIISGGGMLSSAIVSAFMVDVKVSDVAQPVEGDSITIGSDLFIIRSFNYDSEKLVWELNVDIQ